MASHLDYEINKELGECYLFMGELDKARDYYEKAAENNDVHPDPYLGLATIAVQQGELSSAMEMYKKAAAIEPGDKALAGMGLIEMETGDKDRAFDLFAQSLEKNPENMIAVFGLVQLGHTHGRLQDVVPFLGAYLSLDPNKHEVRYSLAGCLLAIGNRDGARTELETILGAEPGHKDARDMLDQLEGDA
ncbi:tetratricopeptide repeat protein [Desulfoplanes sp.]